MAVVPCLARSAPAVKKLEEQSAEKDRQLADVAAAAAATEAAAEEAKRKAEEDFKSELEDRR